MNEAEQNEITILRERATQAEAKLVAAEERAERAIDALTCGLMMRGQVRAARPLPGPRLAWADTPGWLTEDGGMAAAMRTAVASQYD